MKPTDILKSEHRVIEQVLSCLEKVADRADGSAALEAKDGHAIVDFLRNFADRCHHGKEEGQLFPLMEARGFPRNGGPTGVMLREHEQGRALIGAMAGAIDEAAAGKPAALKTFSSNARSYVGLLRAHIQKEDHVLFQMADQTFSSEDQKDLMSRFERLESDDMGAGTHEKYLRLAGDLAERYNVPLATSHQEAGQPCHSCCHGHGR